MQGGGEEEALDDEWREEEEGQDDEVALISEVSFIQSTQLLTAFPFTANAVRHLNTAWRLLQAHLLHVRFE